MTMFTEGRLQMYERMMRDTGERSRHENYDRGRTSDQKSAQQSAKKAVAGKKAGGQHGCVQG